jgi:hypothetical protein
MGSLALQPTEAEVEQTTTGGPTNVELHAEVYGSPTTIVEQDCVGLEVECRPGNTWARRP